jgi:kumamolisin
MIRLAGSVPVNTNQLVGPIDPKERIEITVKLRRKGEDGLPTLDEFIAGKRAVGITRQIIGERYGAARSDADTVQKWAVQQGLSVTQVDLGRRQMHLVGSADAMAKAFDVKISRYKHKRTGTDFRCPETDISVPESLKPIISGVFGLNDMPVIVRNRVRPAHRAQAMTNPQTQFPGSFYPNDVAKLYNFPPQQGQGQRVAILEFGGGFDQSVLADYFTNSLGLATPPTVNSISILGQQMDVNDVDTTGEVYLDIEVVGGMAPKATQDVYFAPWTGQGYLNAIDQAIHNDDYAAISISYGLDEEARGTAANPGWPALNQSVDEAFRDAAAIGLPVFVSSGDQGSGSKRGEIQSGGQLVEVTVLAPAAHCEYPSSSPYATAVGGTMLFAQDGAITDEVVWNELGALQQNQFYFGGATGGGVSQRYPAPSYQTSAGVNLMSANNPPAPGRCVPDVAGNSGALTGYLVSQPPGSQFKIAPVGGTSAAAPMWTALMACVREALGNPPPSFFFNDFVYAAGATPAFRDIVKGRQVTYAANGPVLGPITATGNNRSAKVNGYNSGQGYDLCTGWGSPNGAQLVKQLQTWLSTQAHGSQAPAPQIATASKKGPATAGTRHRTSTVEKV